MLGLPGWRFNGPVLTRARLGLECVKPGRDRFDGAVEQRPRRSIICTLEPMIRESSNTATPAA